MLMRGSEDVKSRQSFGVGVVILRGHPGRKCQTGCFSRSSGARVQHLELARLALLLRLLPPQRHLRGHHALPLRNQRALGARAVPPSAEALMALERGHYSVVPAPRAFRRARVAPLQHRVPAAGGGGSAEEERGRAKQGRADR